MEKKLKVDNRPDPILAPAPRTEPLIIEGRDPVPVTLLTGFLGSGKTTLLNRILNGDHGLKVGVLVNDFGSINIDAELVEGVEENTIKLTNGCVCCEIRDDLVDSLELLLRNTDEIDYVLLEASGVADPEGIIMTFLDKRYEGLLQIDSITCIVDAEAIFTEGDNEVINRLKIRQIAFADMVVLNKVDLVSPKHVEVVHDWINQQINRIRIIEARHCDVPLEILLAVGRFDPVNLVSKYQDKTTAKFKLMDQQVDDKKHSQVFETWSYKSDEPFSLEALKEMVRKDLPASVYRCKGIVFIAEHPTKRFSLQVVGRRTEIIELGDWKGQKPSNQVVAIGSSINENELTSNFEKCKSLNSNIS